MTTASGHTNGKAAIFDAVPILCERGLRILPCNGKRPVHDGWQHKNYTADDVLRALRGIADPMIGLRFGPGSCVDIEADSADEENAFAELFAGCDPPTTPTFKSTRGKHRLFRWDDRLDSTGKGIVSYHGGNGAKLGIRIGADGKGAQSIIPPSTGRVWLLSLDDCDPAPLPDVVVLRILAAAKPKTASHDGHPIELPGDIGERARKYLAKIPPAVSGAGGHDQTFHAACVLTHGFALERGVAVTLLREWNQACRPPWSDRELEHKIDDSLNQPGERGYLLNGESPRDTGRGAAGEEKERKSQATMLVELAGECDLFHDADGEAFARFPVGDGDAFHWEVSRVRNKGFRRWLSRRFYKAISKTPSAQSLQDALGVIEAKAIFDGDKRTVYVRIAEHDGRIYLDLGNDRWQAVEIDRHGWRLVDDPPVVFRRGKSMLALPTPDQRGNVQEFRRFANVTDDDWPLLLGCMVAAMRPIGPYPVLAVYGEHGSAKSTLCRHIRKIVDPNTSPLRADYREPRDLMICANSGWVVALDNLSTIPAWLSDCLCRLSTGGGFSTRTLYENDEETIFDAKRPVILNCIDEVVTRSDLLDRCVLLNLPRIDGGKRIPEAQLDREFDDALPRILGGLLTAVSVAMRNEATVRLPVLPRMADFAIWATAAEPALELKPGEFLAAYAANCSAGNETAIEASPVGKVLIDFVAWIGRWSGTSTDLLREIESRVDDKTKRLKSWPATARALGSAVKRLAPNLREAGVGVEFHRKGKQRTRLIELKPMEQSGIFASASSTPSANEETPRNPAPEADTKREADANGFCPSSADMALFSEENGMADMADKADAKIPVSSTVPEWNEV
jgi:hypothetical protein